MSEEQAEVAEDVVQKKKGGRPLGSKTKKTTEYCIVTWGYTQNQFREEFDVAKDAVIKVPVEDHERKKYKERVPREQVEPDNCFSWECARNERLAKHGKDNKIRVLDWHLEKEEGEDAISQDDGVRSAIADAGA
jgi:hypothetical protein